jgi:gag-polypeptide of LTR copia-type/Retrotransposon gag protein
MAKGDDPGEIQTTKALPAYADPSSPLFLHHSDGPGTSLVAELLTENNYPSWSRAMRFALSSKNKLGFVDGTVPKPDSKSTDHQLWERCDTMVLSWIWSSVSKELTNSVIYFNTAREAWLDLKERYAPSNSIQIFHIQQSISVLVQGEMSVSAYYTTLKGLWDELGSLLPLPACSCGVAKEIAYNQQLERIIKFLMGLNEPYSTIRSQILAMDPMPNLGKIYSFILQEEKQRAVRAPTVAPIEAAALAANTHGRGRGRGRGNNKGERPQCDFCGMLGHT